LNGTVSANNASTTVTFEYGLTTAYGMTKTASPSLVTGASATSVSGALSGLTPNTTYHYRVKAVNAVGTTTGSDMTFTTLPAAATATTGDATGIISTGATLNGTVNANNASTTVTIEYGLTTAYGTTATADESPVAGTTNTAVSKGISGLAPNTTYHYRVVAVNAAGTINGVDKSFTTAAIAPMATTGAATVISSTGAMLNGTVNANNASTTVTFEYGLTTGYGSTATADVSPVTGATNAAVSKGITGLTPNTTYHYRVKAVNTAGTTTGSDMTFTTSGAAPTVTATNISISGATGTGGVFKIGDTVTATWNNTAGGDKNGSTINSVTVDFSAFGGGPAVAATNAAGVWTAVYTITAGSIDSTNRYVSVTATSAGGTTTTQDDTNAAVDNIAPTVTATNIAIGGASGPGGVYIVGDTVTATWNNTEGGDNNTDTITSVTVDFSAFGGGTAVAATNAAGTWTATYTITTGSISGTNKNVSVTVTDNAGNTRKTQDNTNAAVDAAAPTVINVSSLNADGTYGAGDTISVAVSFGENVTVSGTPRLTLETGGTDRTASYYSGSGTNTLIFTYTVQAGDVSADLDYTATNALSLNGGTIRDEAGNNAVLTLPAPGAFGSLGADKAIVIDALPTFSVNDPSVTEGNAGTETLTFTVTLSTASDNTISVVYATADGTATAGVDYTATSGTLTFAPGETSKTITVLVIGDTTTEPDETLLLILSNPHNAKISKAQGTATILNDDTPQETKPTATFTATGPNTGTLSSVSAGMKYSVDGGTSWMPITGTTMDIAGVTAANGVKVYQPGNGSTTVDSDIQAITVTKAATPSLTATQPSTIDGSGSIPMTAAVHEYSANDGSSWTTATGNTALTAGTYLVRVKAAGTVLASDNQSITLTAFTGTQETTPTATFNATGSDTGTLTGVTSGMKYRIDSGAWTDITSSTDINLTGLSACTISVVRKGNSSTTTDSVAQTIAVTKVSVPTTVGKTDCTTAANNDGKLTGVTTEMEYKLSTASVWTAGTGSDITGLASGTYNVRVKATGTVLASDAQNLTIAAYSAPPSGGGGGGSVTTTAPVTEIPNGGSTTSSNLDQLVSEGKSLTVTGESGAKLVFETDALKGIDGQTSGEIKVEMKDVSPAHQENLPGKQVFSLTVSSGGNTVSNFGGYVTISLPYELKAGENAEAVTVWYLAGDGTMTEIPCTYNPVTKLATFKVTHFSLYVVGVNTTWVNPFADVTESDWFYGAVAFANRNGLFSGTGADTFSPGSPMTRAMLWTVLGRLDGQSLTGSGVYDAARSWAMGAGITDGADPDGSITREQMVTILWRYAGSPKASGELSGFSDVGSVASYAMDAMTWAVESGIISGADGALMPQANATRAQVAAILQRFIEATVKIS
jgi:hypothetical protein